MSKSRHGKSHFMERGKKQGGNKGFRRTNQASEGQDWRKAVRQMPHEED